MERRFTKEEWQTIIKEWEDCELSRKEFCRQRNLKLTTFDYWRNKGKKERKDSSGFIRIPRHVHRTQSVFKLEVNNIYRVEIPFAFDSDALLRLLTTLEATR
ncbi:MAG: hypothetical protein KAU17_14785 [Spirochaetales bacterium]|nr:hypothetical protein [Spirochaetales bacterium]